MAAPRQALTPATSPEPLEAPFGTLASLALLLPAPGHMGRAFLALAVAIAGTASVAAGVGKTPGTVVTVMVIGVLALAGFLMLGLVMLAQWRVLANRLAAARPMPLALHDVPLTWRLFLLPYRPEDTSRLVAAGRLADLMTLSMMLMMAFGLLLGAVLEPQGYSAPDL
ncbi:hypothetical protein [Nitrospirillum sp. BR 11163]|uniref:hypothetical protein n=1 Tax=Nitrospirillum sp. BR 11163 TaxID=3104323 RepID=UPI002AFFC14B|nr:hypothetical protein [Nitrospirillum sp. BR 11163]MEA1673576.1 hypothetical protein [Nitrospirillum sp. BR 11163]